MFFTEEHSWGVLTGSPHGLRHARLSGEKAERAFKGLRSPAKGDTHPTYGNGRQSPWWAVGTILIGSCKIRERGFFLAKGFRGNEPVLDPVTRGARPTVEKAISSSSWIANVKTLS